MVRTRFAPSPTGPLHMGGVRTALYNYLFARQHQGIFVLRMEDTDRSRYVKRAEDYIHEALEWCGLIPDEGPQKGGAYGPYRQSERKDLYRPYAEHLLETGHAYYAFDTNEELEAMRERAKAAKQPAPQYNAITRNSMKNSLTLPDNEVKERLQRGDPYTIRIKVPREETIRFHDQIRGWVTVNTRNLDDKVLFKSDGMPTYHMANVLDDHLMGITHVIRGEEWLPSAPLHVLLYRYLGWEEDRPEFAHIPLILRPDGNGKLSKRDGDRLGFPVYPLEWTEESGDSAPGYREEGYFPEAFINMLAFLGWNPGTEEELFTLNELVEAFSLERVGKAGARFDANKTRWYNQQYLRKRSGAELAEMVKPRLNRLGIKVPEEGFLKEVCDLMKERATFPRDIVDEGNFFFRRPENYDPKTLQKKWKADTPGIISEIQDVLAKVSPFDAEHIENAFKAHLEEKGWGLGKVMPNFRLLLTGKGAGPSVFEIAALLGKEETLERIRIGLEQAPLQNSGAQENS